MRRWIAGLLAALMILPVGTAAAQQYYKTQLQGSAAVLYTALLDNLEIMKTQAGAVELTNYFSDNAVLADTDGLLQDLETACRALKYDYPELFWLSSAQIRMRTTKITRGNTVLRYQARIEPPEGGDYFAQGDDQNSVAEKLAQMEAAADRIAAEAAQKDTDYAKIRAAHDILVRETSYDKDQQNNSHLAYGALVEHKAVCDGYAKAFQMVMNRLGIACISIEGEANANGETGGHMWNAVQLEGNWYGVDVTWDDPVTADGTFEMLRHTYFLLGESAMNESHTPRTTFFEGGPSYELPALHSRSYREEQFNNFWQQFLVWLGNWRVWQWLK